MTVLFELMRLAQDHLVRAPAVSAFLRDLLYRRMPKGRQSAASGMIAERSCATVCVERLAPVIMVSLADL